MALPDGIVLPDGITEEEAMAAFHAYTELKSAPPQNDYQKMSPEDQAKFDELEHSKQDMTKQIDTEKASQAHDAKMVGIGNKIGDTALTTGGAALGAAAGLGAGALATGATTTTGEMLGRHFSKVLGFRDELGASDLVSPNPLQNPAIGNFGIPLIVKGWKALRGAISAAPGVGELTPEVKEAVDIAQRKGQFQGTTVNDKDLTKLKDEGVVKPKQRDALEAGVNNVQTIADQAAKPEQMIKVIGAELGAQGAGTNIEKAVADTFYKKATPLLKTDFFESVHNADDLVTAARDAGQAAYQTKQTFAKTVGDKVIITKADVEAELGDIKEFIAKKAKSTETAGVSQAVQDRIDTNLADFGKKVRGGTIDANGKRTLGTGTVGNNLEDVTHIVEDLNFARRELLKQFDSPNIAKGVVGDSVSQENGIKAIAEIQDAIEKAMHKKVAQAVADKALNPAEAERFLKTNELYGAYKATEELGEKFVRGSWGGLATRDSTRLIQNANVARNALPPMSAKDVAKRILQKINSGPSPVSPNATELAQTLARDTSSVKNIQGFRKIAGQNVSLPSPVTPKPPSYLGALAGGKMARDIGLYIDHPEAMDAFALEGADPQTVQQTQQAFQSGTEDEKKRAIAILSSSMPGMFEPPEVPGMNSMVNGVIHDPIEKQAAVQKVSEVFRDDTIKRLKSKDSINGGKPMDPFAVEALGGTVNREKGPVDSFLEEAEGGQKLQAYYPKVKNSGVTVGTGIDLGERSVEELRGLDIPEQLVTKLAPYVGKKDDQAKKALKHSPLELTPEEANLLDEKIKGQIKTAITDNYETATSSSFENLPDEAKTGVFSLAYNFGPDLEKKLPTLWAKVVKGDWEGVQTFLRKTKWVQPELKDRRMKEAALLEPLIPRTPGDDIDLKSTMVARMASESSIT